MNPQMLQKLCFKPPKFSNATNSETVPSMDCGIFSSINLSQSLPEDPQTREEFESVLDFRRVSKEVEEYVKNRRIALEEKMFEKFYLMRIEQSRKFIELIKKINKSWDDFVDYLKSIGAQGASGDGDCTVYSLTNSSSLTALSQVTNDSK